MLRRSDKMRLTYISLLCLVFLISINGCSKPKWEISKEENSRKMAEKLAYLSHKYNAVIDWNKDINEFSSFTIQYQKALIRNDGRPSVFIVQVEDVFYRSGSYWGVFSSFPTPGSFYLVDELSNDQYESARKLPLMPFSEYLVVSTVTDIEKPLFSPEIDTKEGGPQIVLETSSSVVIRGKLVDILRGD